MKEYFLQIIRSKDLRNKIIFTLAVLAFVRLLSSIPLPQVDRAALDLFMGRAENQVFGVLGMFTGGSLSRLSLDMLGVGPYITASIIIQLLTKAIPAWENIQKESPSGKEKLNQYARYLTVPLAVLQSYSMVLLLKSQGVFPGLTNQGLVEILIITAATSIFVMWLGELITEKGIGNGISLIIALSIVVGLPQQIVNTLNIVEGGNLLSVIIFLIIAAITILVVVFVNEAERKVPITYARRGTNGGAVDSFLPIKVNTAGVIPIIFALSFLTFPAIIARFLTTARSESIQNFGNSITDALNNNLVYGLAYFIFVFAFTFFYTYIVFQPEQISENLQKQGGFIPGIRPGSETISFLKYTVTRLTMIGALFLALIAVLPNIMSETMDVQNLVIGGTSILIVVSVVLDTARQFNSQFVMRRYDKI